MAPPTTFNFQSKGADVLIGDLKQIQKQFDSYNDEVVKISKNAGISEKAARGLVDALGPTKLSQAVKAINDLNAAGGSLADKFNALKTQLDLTDTELKALFQTISQTPKADGIAKARAEVKQYGDAVLQTASTFKMGFAESQKFIQGLGLTSSKAAEVSARFVELRGAGATTQQTFRQLRGEFGLNEQQLKQLEGQYGRFKQSAENLQQGLQGIVGIAGAVAGSLGLIGAKSLQTAIEVEALQTKLNFAAGGAREGAEAFKFVQDEADRLKVPILESSKAFASLSAATRGTVLEGESTKKTFTALAQAGRVLNLSTEDVNGLFLATTQVISKGKVQAEELRGQIGERLPGAFNIFARSLGISTQELDKLLEQGKVGLPEFEKFIDQLAKETASGLPGALETTRAAQEDFNNQIIKTQTIIGNQLLPAFGAFNSAAAGVVRGFNELPGPIQKVIVTYGGYIGVLSAAIAAIAAYNLAQGPKIASELKDAAVLIAKTAAQTASTAATTVATAAVYAYNTSVLAATAAQLAFTAALGGVIAAAAVIDTYSSIRGGAESATDATKSLSESLKGLKEDLSGEIKVDIPKEPIEQARAELNLFQQLLDNIRGTFGATTAAQERLNNKVIAFNDTLTQGSEATLEAAKIQNKLDKGYNASEEELKAYSKFLDQSISALKSAKAPTQELANAQQAQLDKLLKTKTALEEKTKAQQKDVKATKEALKAQADALKNIREDEKRQDSQKFEDTARADKESFDNKARKSQQQFDSKQAKDKQSFEDKQAKAKKRFDDQNRKVQQGFDDKQRDEKRAFDDSQRDKQKAFDDRQKDEKIAFDLKQQAAQRNVEKQLQRDKDAFEKRQRAAQKQFEKDQQKEKEDSDKRFKGATDKLDLQAKQNKTTDPLEKQKLQKEFDDRKKFEEQLQRIKENTAAGLGDPNADPIAQAQQLLGQSDSSFFQPLTQLTEDQITRLKETIAEIKTATDAGLDEKQKKAKEDEDERQRTAQAEFDAQQETFKTQKELERQAAQVTFEKQQTEAKRVNDEALRKLQQDFEDKQRTDKTTFEDAQRVKQQTFDESQKKAQQTFEDQQKTAKQTFEDGQRAKQQTFEDQQREKKRAFEEQQRKLDEESAQKIKALLESTTVKVDIGKAVADADIGSQGGTGGGSLASSADPSTPTAGGGVGTTGTEGRAGASALSGDATPIRTRGGRRIPGRYTGGPVDAGNAYLVGERGPEVIVPGASGYVLNNSQTEALRGLFSTPNVPPTPRGTAPRTDSTNLNQVVGELQSLKQVMSGVMLGDVVANFNNDPDPVGRFYSMLRTQNRVKIQQPRR